MPITIPEFVQFQASLFPLRGLWNAAPNEGDRFVNAEIDWGSPGLLGVSCVQFQLSGNSPLAFSQIVALSVDNSRCGSDVDFIFPDSGFLLTVPGFNQGVYPVFTNALMFYVSAPLAELGDITIAQILNSMPPPVAIQPSREQQQASATGIDPVTGITQIIPTGTAGTLNTISIAYGNLAPATGGSAGLELLGPGLLWAGFISTAPTEGQFPVSGLNVRFSNGVQLAVNSSSLTAGYLTVNLYYSVP